MYRLLVRLRELPIAVWGLWGCMCNLQLALRFSEADRCEWLLPLLELNTLSCREGSSVTTKPFHLAFREVCRTWAWALTRNSIPGDDKQLMVCMQCFDNSMPSSWLAESETLGGVCAGYREGLLCQLGFWPTFSSHVVPEGQLEISSRLSTETLWGTSRSVSCSLRYKCQHCVPFLPLYDMASPYVGLFLLKKCLHFHICW